MTLTSRQRAERASEGGRSVENMFDIDDLEVEMEYVQLYIDKTAGDSMPNYDNENYISDDDGLVTAISKLDAAIAIQTQPMAEALYDFSIDGGLIGDIDLEAGAALLPDNAVITQVVMDVITSPTSAGNTGTIKFKLPTDGDITLNIPTSTTVSGIVFGIPDGTPISMMKTTAAREVQAEIATENLTAGKIKIFIYYLKSE